MLDAIDRFQQGDSFLHRLDPRAKVVLTALAILTTVLLPDGVWGVYLILFLWVMFWVRVAGIDGRYFVTRSLLILPFVLTAFSILFITPGQPLAVWTLGPWRLVPTDAGLIHFLSILARATLALQMAVLLTATTPFPDLLHALRHLHLPRTLINILAFMHRYLFVLSDEATRLHRAQQARSAQVMGLSPRRGLWWRAKIVGGMVAQLFLRSLERGERVHRAMLARGYRGYIYTLHAHKMRPRDWAAIVFTILFLLLLQLVARLSLL